MLNPLRSTCSSVAKWCRSLTPKKLIQQTQFLDGPGGGFGDHFVLIPRQLFEQRKKFLVSAVAHGDDRVPAQSCALRAAHRRAAKRAAEIFLADLGQPVERRIYQIRPGLKLRRLRGRRFPVPGANILANVTAENVPPIPERSSASSGSVPRFSIVRYAMQRLEST